MRVLIADPVPLANKGELAIVLGIQQLLSRDESVEVGVFDSNAAHRPDDHLTSFPESWVLRGRMRTGRRRTLRRAWVTLLETAHIPAGRLSRLTRRPPEELGAFLAGTDLVLVGHDGALAPESMTLIRLAHRAGKPVGVLGAGISPPSRLRRLTGSLYKRRLLLTRFCVVRERQTLDYLLAIGLPAQRVRLLPDPAFAMQPAPATQVDAYLARCEWYTQARRASRLLVGVTVCERSRIFEGSFLEASSGTDKRRQHAEFVAGLLDELVEERDAQIVFLVHASGTDSGSDLWVSNLIASTMQTDPSHRNVLEDDLDPRLLKAIIGRLDIFVGERTHSLIAAASTATPFLALTNRYDTRTLDIIGDMCRSSEWIIDMSRPDPGAARQRAITLADQRTSRATALAATAHEIESQLAEISDLVLRELGG